MDKQAFELSPSCGWSKFKSHDDVVEKVFDTLTLRDNGGPWVYYNFTSESSMWELDTESVNSLSILYEEENGPDTDELRNMPIQSVSVTITPNEKEDYLELENLVQCLLETFSLEKRSSNNKQLKE